MLTLVSAGAVVVPAALAKTPELAAQAAAKGLIVTVLIYTLGGISGAHLNPAVTLTFALRGAFPWRNLLPYWGAQFAGALGAAFVLRIMFGDASSQGITKPGPGISDGVALGIELILSLLLLSVILGTAEEAKLTGPNAGLAVGATIALAVCFADPVSGASMNAFRSLAPAIVSGHLAHAWIYVLAPLLASCGAAALTWYFHGPPNPSERKAGRGRT
ncbi:MAG: aquaporin [Candidatus Eremiobacteraeota bacterium]|nr:aquaporin [Candidatus Eremiobacteraeota bacterium]MBV8365519.1 aquaporin [Candidatus Eremiobacteraeota bacterium]